MLQNAAHFLGQIQKGVAFKFFTRMGGQQCCRQDAHPIVQAAHYRNRHVHRNAATGGNILDKQYSRLTQMLHPLTLKTQLFPSYHLFIGFSHFSIILEIIVKTMRKRVQTFA